MNFYQYCAIASAKGKTVDELLMDQQALVKQVTKSQEIVSKFKTEKSSEIASSVLLNNL